jgi:hypothetical protein
MATVTLDIGRDSQVTQTKNGYTVRCVALVTDVAAGASLAAQYLSALSAPGLPAINSVHPVFTDSYLVSRSPKWIANGKVEVTLEWQPSDSDPAGSTLPPGASGGSGGTIRVGVSLAEESKCKDRQGNAVELEYTNPKTGKAEEAQSGVWTKRVPRVMAEFIRTEDESPLQKAKEFVGTVANSGWRFDPGVGNYKWMCTGISGDSNDRGETYVVTYSFEYNEDGFDPLVVYTIDGKPAPKWDEGVNATTASKIVDVYAPKDFNTLGLA